MSIKRSPSTNYERLHAFTAGADLSDKVYTFVKFSTTAATAGQVVNADADALVHGVLIHGAKQNATCEVLTEHGARVVLKLGATTGSVTPGTRLISGAGGVAIPLAAATSDATAHHAVVIGDGVIVTGSDSQAGKFVEAIFLPNTSS